VYFVRLISSVYSFPSFSELKLLVFGNSALVYCLYLLSLVRKPTATDTESSCHSPQHQETALPYEPSKELPTVDSRKRK